MAFINPFLEPPGTIAMLQKQQYADEERRRYEHQNQLMVQQYNSMVSQGVVGTTISTVGNTVVTDSYRPTAGGTYYVEEPARVPSRKLLLL